MDCELLSDADDVHHATGFVLQSPPENQGGKSGLAQWVPCCLILRGNRLEVSLVDDVPCCVLDVCTSKAYEPFNAALPSTEGATYFSCSGVLSGTTVYETVVCCALDSSSRWYVFKKSKYTKYRAPKCFCCDSCVRTQALVARGVGRIRAAGAPAGDAGK